jgi:predicted anti-sigma-YlaC factor YlaD
MDCKEIQEMLPDLAAGIEARTPEVEKHIASCKACFAKLNEFEQTMALLDEWQAPEPSPYFNTRLQARLREEMARPPAPWYRKLTQNVFFHPAWTMSFAAAIFMVALAAGNRSYIVQTGSISTNPPALGLPVQPGTAVADLQALERNDDLYADFDVLDQLQVQDDTNANP